MPLCLCALGGRGWYTARMPDSAGTRTPPAFLFALGRAPMPEIVEGGGRGSGQTSAGSVEPWSLVNGDGAEGEGGAPRWRFVKLYKHDFFAATGMYELEGSKGEVCAAGGASATVERGGRAVLKMQRVQPLLGVPMKWLGACVARHEIAVYEALQGVPGVPKFLGRVGATGFLHEFVEGEDLRADAAVTAEFFGQLRSLLEAVHARHVAYVDTNKRENILLGADGRPWLIDFQISFFTRKGERDNFLARAILRRLQRTDWYHFYKHKTRLLPGECTPEDFAAAQRRGLLHTLHRWLAQPVIRLRRRCWRAIGWRRRRNNEGTKGAKTREGEAGEMLNVMGGGGPVGKRWTMKIGGGAVDLLEVSVYSESYDGIRSVADGRGDKGAVWEPGGRRSRIPFWPRCWRCWRRRRSVSAAPGCASKWPGITGTRCFWPCRLFWGSWRRRYAAWRGRGLI